MLLVPAVAVVVVLAAVWFLGTRDVPGFASDDEVRALLRAEHPEFLPAEIARSGDARSAIACTGASTSLVVAFVVGNQRTSHLLSSGDVRAVQTRIHAGEVVATIQTHDLGCPTLHLTLNASAWRRWQARLEALVDLPTSLHARSAQ